MRPLLSLPNILTSSSVLYFLFSASTFIETFRCSIITPFFAAIFPAERFDRANQYPYNVSKHLIIANHSSSYKLIASLHISWAIIRPVVEAK